MDLRQAIWDARLEAKWRGRYYQRRGNGFARRARMLEYAAAVAGSGSVVAWLAQNASVSVPIFGAAAVLLSILPLGTRYGLWALECEIAFKHWLKRDRAWDHLWLRLESGIGQVSIEQFAAERERDLDFDHPSSESDLKLADLCQVETSRMLGLAIPPAGDM